MRRVLAVALCGALAMPALATDPVRTCPCRAHKLNPTVLRLWGFATLCTANVENFGGRKAGGVVWRRFPKEAFTYAGDNRIREC